MSLEETRKKIISNNFQITNLLKENEDLLKTEGFNVPVKNYRVDDMERIQIPSGYIRTSAHFFAKYHLNEIVKDFQVRNNISYSLQVSDFYNYLVNRFHIWGSVETVFFKNAIINHVSILEALVFECANNICSPDGCKKINNCKRHFNKKQRENSFKALKRLKEIGVVDYDDKKIARIKEIIDLRNRVHIRLAKENEFNSSDFCLSLYNEVVLLTQNLAEDIYKNGVKLYYCGKGITR